MVVIHNIQYIKTNRNSISVPYKLFIPPRLESSQQLKELKSVTKSYTQPSVEKNPVIWIQQNY